ncbi:ATP-grasp domain-containing protein [Senegalia massiliensis]|uniref:ATP-grasp domain-containing protein n=1 Tax=Senegalia massiliensis TaxID=1720316 RepID=UPI0013EEEEA4|nr:ATP-grasp domain-containing protein [Senegalia massiliensis]
MKKKVLIVGHNKKLIEHCTRSNIIVDNLIDQWDYEEDRDNLSEVRKRLYVEDVRKLDQVSAIFIGKPEKYDAIITSYEGGMITAGFLEFLINKKFKNYEQSFIMRNKYLQKLKAKECVPVTKIQILENLYELKNEDIYLTYPIVIKPIDGFATNSTFVIDTFENLIVMSHKLNKGKKYLIEEFVNGQEYFADGYIVDGKLGTFCVSKYEKPVIQINQGHVVKAIQVHPEANKALYSEVESFLTKTLKSLDYQNGVFHLEFFSSSGQYVFSECGARPGGGMIVDCYQSLFGLNLNELVASTQLKLNIEEPSLSDEAYGFSYIPVLRKDIKELPSLSDLKQHFQFVKGLKYDWKIGDKIPDMKKNSMRRVGIFEVSIRKDEDSFDKLNEVIDYFKGL